MTRRLSHLLLLFSGMCAGCALDMFASDDGEPRALDDSMTWLIADEPAVYLAPGRVSGYLQLAGVDDHDAIAIQFYRDGQRVDESATDAAGRFDIDVEMGVYDLVLDAPRGYLNGRVPAFTVRAGENNVVPCMRLVRGDMNGDGRIDRADVDWVVFHEHTGDLDALSYLDIDGDGVIDERDRQRVDDLVAVNRGLEGPTGPGDALSTCLTCATLMCDPSATCDDSGGPALCTCDIGFVGDGLSCRRPHSCADLLADNPDTPSGVYAVDGDGDGPEPSVDAYCAVGASCAQVSCSAYASCTPSPAAAQCMCLPGYLPGDGLSCAAPPSCAAQLALAPDSASGVYAIDPDGSGPVAAMDVFCDMDTNGGGWTLALVKNSLDADTYDDFASTYEDVADLAVTPEAASLATATSARGGWLNLNEFGYQALQIASYHDGAQTFRSAAIARADLRIDFGESGYYLYDADNSYTWCGGDRSFTDGGVGQVNPPAGAGPNCKNHSILGSGWDFSIDNVKNVGLTLCGSDGQNWMMHSWNDLKGKITYENAGAAQAIWVR